MNTYTRLALGAALCATLGILLTGCENLAPDGAGNDTKQRSADAPWARTYIASNAYLLTDPETGCEYIAVNGGSIFPRLYSDGEQVGCYDLYELAPEAIYQFGPDGERVPYEHGHRDNGG